MQLILKYHGELCDYFPGDQEDNTTTVDISPDDSICSVIEKFNIPREKVNLILVNGVNVREEDCTDYRFSDGDILAVWPSSR